MTVDNMFNDFQGDLPLSEIKNIIKVGDIVGVKISYEAEWISDVIEGISPEEHQFEIRLLEHFINQDLMVGDVIHCKIINQDVEYVMSGKVVDVGIHNPLTAVIQTFKISKYSNARRSKRYTVNLCAKVTYNDNEKSAFATVKNISSSGVSLTCREFIRLNEDIDVDIVLWRQQVMSIEGKVVRMYKVNNNYKYGVLIENMDKKSRELLEEFITELEEKEKELTKY